MEIDKVKIIQYSKILQGYEQSKQDDTEYQEVKEMIKYSKDQREKIETNYKEITRALKGKVFSDEVNDLFVNDITDTEALSIMNIKAAIFDVQQIHVEVKPRYLRLKDDEVENQALFDDVATMGRILNDAYLSKTKFVTTISDAIKYSRGYPMGITLLSWDDNAVAGSDTNLKGDITCENIPVENFWWDAACINIDDCEYCFITKLLPYFRLKKFVNSLNNKQPELLEAYHYLLNNNKDVIKTLGNNLVDDDDLLKGGAIQLLCLYKKENDKVKVYYFIGKKYLVGTQTLDIPYLPFAILKEQSAPNAFTGISSVMLALPCIRQKAYIDAVCNNIATTQKSPVYIVGNQSGINAEQLVDVTSSDTAKVLSANGDVNNSVVLLPNPKIDADIIAFRNNVIQDIQRVIGGSDIANGVNFGSAISGAATQSMIDQATQRENTSITELQKYLVRFTRIMLQYIKAALLKQGKGKNNEIQFRVNNINDNKGSDINDIIVFNNGFDWLRNFELDVDIDVSLLRASKKSKQQQDLISLYQIERQYNKGENTVITMEDIAETLNLPNKQQLLNRIKFNSEQQKLLRANDLVNTVLTLMELPDIQQIGVEQAVALALAAQEDPAVRQEIENMIVATQQEQMYQEQMLQREVDNLINQDPTLANTSIEGEDNE